MNMHYCYYHHEMESSPKVKSCIWEREIALFHPTAVVCFNPDCSCKAFTKDQVTEREQRLREQQQKLIDSGLPIEE